MGPKGELLPNDVPTGEEFHGDTSSDFMESFNTTVILRLDQEGKVTEGGKKE